MTATIDRNPDVKLDTEKVPAGMCLIEGKALMMFARSARPPVPFGVATRINATKSTPRHETVGLIIRNEDRERMLAAIATRKPRHP